MPGALLRHRFTYLKISCYMRLCLNSVTFVCIDAFQKLLSSSKVLMETTGRVCGCVERMHDRKENGNVLEKIYLVHCGGKTVSFKLLEVYIQCSYI